MTNKAIKQRITAIRRRMVKNTINCLLLTKPANVTYTTGFLGDDSWAAITQRGVYLLTDSRYTEQAQSQCPNCRIIERTDSLPQAIGKLLKKLKSVHTVAIEKSTSLANFDALKKNIDARVKKVVDIVESERTCKNAGEIAAIKKAAEIAAHALKKTIRHIKPGMTENELAGILDLQIRKAGARNCFETIVAFGPNASRPHHQPTAGKLNKKDTVLIDFGVRFNGYCSDITRCFAVGSPTAFYKKVYQAVQQAQVAAIKTVKAGVGIKQVDAAARKVINDYGFPVYGHGTGHGLGLEIHEKPFLNQQNNEKLLPGQVLTIEPGAYIPGKLGIRIEDDLLVTKTGHKILTCDCPHPLSLSV
ncbi:MAG: M24 family metallopeptidase [Planctomycetota bacterium]|jgi:Xaa-Pro aminopeptidase